MKPISIIIPVWNAVEYTKRCVGFLLKCKSSITNLIIVDNGSTDNTRDFLKELDKKDPNWLITYHYNENKGFVEAVNKGIELAGEDHDIIILNNDVEIHDPKLIGKLQEKCYSLEKCAAISPKQMSFNWDFLCGPAFTLPISKVGMSYGNQRDVNQFPDDTEAEIVMFACCYIKNEALKEVGILDRNIHSYAEDSDWCLRARIKGWKIWHAGSLQVLHYHNVTAQENKMQLDRLRLSSVEYYADKHKKYYEQDRYEAEINVHGVVGFPTGYSKMCEHIMRNLENFPRPVRVNYGFLYGITNYSPRTTDYYINDLLNRPAKRGGIQLLIGQGDVFYKNSGDYAIGFSMMDCDRWPEEWAAQANQLDELFVPTEHGRQVMIESGIKPKITTIPLGIDPNYYHPEITPIHTFRHIKYRRQTNFISCFEWGERKQPELLIEAWFKAFSDNPDIALFIKFTNSDPQVNVHQQMSMVINKYIKHSKTMVVSLSDEKYRGFKLEEIFMPSLYRSHDAFVWTSAGEGFGFPPVEALACGLPVGITGQYGYLPEHPEIPGVTLFDYEQERVSQEICRCEYYWGANWSKPKLDDVVDKLRWMYQNLDSLKQEAVTGSKIIRQDLSWERTSQKIKDRIFEIK